jgi:hypothetical protein
MVKIDRKVREVISQIKIAEAQKADAQNTNKLVIVDNWR